MVRICIWVLLCIALSSTYCEAQHPVLRALGVRSEKDTADYNKQGFALVPLLYYTPDTRFAFGASLVYYFSISAADSLEKDTRLSYIQTLVDYTQNNQFDFWATWNIFTRNENYLLKGEMRYRNFPDRFYGIGNKTPQSAEERYSYDLLSFKTLMMRKVRKNLFMGADVHMGREYNFTFEEGRQLASGDITGAEELNEVGFGFVVTYDTRDNVINAFHGNLLEISTYHYNKALGSTFQFTNLNFTAQHYKQIRPKHVLALQFRSTLNFGNVPFLDMAMAGNDDLLRGYARNRFRDRHFGGTQAEYRFPIYKRLGGVVFSGVGDVFRHTDDLAWRHLKYSVGAGLRFMVNPIERLNIRLDVGLGRNSLAYYLMVTESF